MIEAVSVIGLGKLGAPLCAVLAAAGVSVIGVDSQPSVVRTLLDGCSPVSEPDVPDLIAANRERLSATSDIAAAVAATDATLVIVPTPSEESGRFSARAVEDVVRAIGAALRGTGKPHLVVIVSTVSPGTMAESIAPALEAASGRRHGQTIGLCYAPLFVALGDVVAGLRRPDLVLIGESDEAAGAQLEGLWRRIATADPPFFRMNWLNAELAKLAVNAYIALKISFANNLAGIAEAMPGADVDVITRAIGRDRRIGPSFLRGGMPFGGPCLPRDVAALSALCRALGLGHDLMTASEAINGRRLEQLLALIDRQLPQRDATIGVLGLAFKPGTPALDASPAVNLALRLAGAGRRVVAHDPMAGAAARNILPPGIVVEADAGTCLRQSDLVVIATPWDEYRRLDPDLFARDGGGLTVIDCWRLLEGTPAAKTARLVQLGVARWDRPG
jgi:UDPglucose 6-dehydrogenase